VLTRTGSLFRDIATFYRKIGFFLRRLDTKQTVITEQAICFDPLFCLGKSLAKYKIRRQEEIDHWNPIQFFIGLYRHRQ
jgi:hypothetical protein